MRKRTGTEVILQSGNRTLVFESKVEACRKLHIGRDKIEELLTSGDPFVFEGEVFYFDELYKGI